jgi:uncharacterized protein
VKVVIDTNCLLVSISRNSKFNWLVKSFINKDFNICISSEILNEYEEIIGKYFSQNVLEPFFELLVTADNSYKINTTFKLNLIENDPDDNKFVDCAFAGNVDFLITNDSDFNVLRNIEFPKINIISLQEFEEFLIENRSKN